jgi:putative membrane protein
MMLLHAGAPLAPHDAPWAFSFEPIVVFVLAATVVLYLRGTAVLLNASRRGAVLRRQRIFFLGGWLALAVALVSPVHAMGSVLFSAHMVQHELMMTVAAPLLVLGFPFMPILWSLPQNTRKTLGRTLSRRVVRDSWKLVSSPVSATLLHGGAIWIWHAPTFYNASVRSELVHSLQHYSFIVTALVFWWALLGARKFRGQPGLTVMCLFITAMHTSLLGALLATSDLPLYAAYGSTTAWGLTQLEDQQLGGIIMWVPGGIPYVVAALLLLLGRLRQPHTPVQGEERGGRVVLSPQVARTLVFLVVLLTGCGQRSDSVADMTGGHPSRGREAMRKYGCQSCHTIPGVTGTKALVGPPLAGIAERSFIGGVLTNSPENMISWLRDPPAAAPRTAMPNLGVTEKDARDMAAYLYTLR